MCQPRHPIVGQSHDIIPGIQINADPDLLLQTLHGLLENAVRYAESEVLVSCRAENSTAVLEIHNDRNQATIATPGIGLGLRLVRSICKASAWHFETREAESEFKTTIRFGVINSLAFLSDNG